jgi:hypothetical protein
LRIPAPSAWPESGVLKVVLGHADVDLHWLGKAAEKKWLIAGTARSASKTKA